MPSRNPATPWAAAKAANADMANDARRSPIRTLTSMDMFAFEAPGLVDSLCHQD